MGVFAQHVPAQAVIGGSLGTFRLVASATGEAAVLLNCVPHGQGASAGGSIGAGVPLRGGRMRLLVAEDVDTVSDGEVVSYTERVPTAHGMAHVVSADFHPHNPTARTIGTGADVAEEALRRDAFKSVARREQQACCVA